MNNFFFLFTLHQCLLSPGLGPCPDHKILMRLRHSPPETAHRLQKDLVFSSVIWGQMLFQMFLCQECELWRSKEKQVLKKNPTSTVFSISHDTQWTRPSFNTTLQPVTRVTGTFLTMFEFSSLIFDKRKSGYLISNKTHHTCQRTTLQFFHHKWCQM